jgi:hypothetical protein
MTWDHHLKAVYSPRYCIATSTVAERGLSFPAWSMALIA